MNAINMEVWVPRCWGVDIRVILESTIVELVEGTHISGCPLIIRYEQRRAPVSKHAEVRPLIVLEG